MQRSADGIYNIPSSTIKGTHNHHVLSLYKSAATLTELIWIAYNPNSSMSANRVRALEGFVQSWVIAPDKPKEENPTSTAENSKNQQDTISLPPKNDKDKNNVSPESSVYSGPELIMPSLDAISITEGSWFAPDLRPEGQSLRKRRKKAGESEKQKKNSKVASEDSSKAASSSPKNERENTSLRALASSFLTWVLEKIIRPGINLLLFAAILHILVVPELVYQHPSLCGIALISKLYPAKCAAPRYQQHHGINPLTRNSPSRYDSIITSQRKLETLFNGTLQALTPLNISLKQSESMLRNVHGDLKQIYPGVKNALDLEFQGCWQAIRAAVQNFDSLKADMQSAVSSLMATGSLQANLGIQEQQQQQTTLSAAPLHYSDATKATRLSTQLLRREQYLERLSSQMQSKADSLCDNLATLDDHLESIEAIVNREEKYHHQQNPHFSQSDDQSLVRSSLRAAFDSFLPHASGKFFSTIKKPSSSSTDEDPAVAESPYRSVPRLLRNAASRHRPVMVLTQKLSRQLQNMQRNKIYS
ncbi:hypothetical protein MAP00_002839 [Monascus purpureus]|nr:hypothetical protein MAP00_002839 [Monascus purpureus]